MDGSAYKKMKWKKKGGIISHALHVCSAVLFTICSEMHGMCCFDCSFSPATSSVSTSVWILSLLPPFTSSYLFSGSTVSMFGDVQRDGFSCISYVLQCKLYFFAKGCFLQEQKKKSPVWDTGLRSFQLSFDGSEDVFNCASLIITWLPVVTIHVLGIMCRLNKLTKSVCQILETVSSRMDWITWFTSKAFRKSTTNVTYVDAMLSSGLLTIF